MFSCLLVFFLLGNASENNLISEGEPDCLVIILHKLALHPEDLDLVELLYVIGHLVALLDAIFERFVLYELNIRAQAAIVVMDALVRFLGVHWCIELDDRGFTNATL